MIFLLRRLSKFYTILIYMSDVLVIGALKPKDHCCYDICGAVIHVETTPELNGYGNTLDLLHDSVRKYLPTQDKSGLRGSDDSYSKPGQGSKDTNKNEKYKNVAFHASRISEKYYQIVLVDRTNNIQNAIDIGYQAYDQIMSHNKGKDLDRFYVWVETSGTGPPSVWKTPGGVFGVIILSFLCVIIVYLLVKGEIKKTSVYVEVTRLYGYVPNFPIPSNVREFMNNKLNWRDGRSRSIDLSFSRLGAGSRAEDISGNFENPLYQEFCKRTTEEPPGKSNSMLKRELGIDSGIKESGSSVSFKALQGRIEGVQINNKKEANFQIHHGPGKLENRSFDNPLFGVNKNLQTDTSLAKISAVQPIHLDVNLLNPLQKSSSNPSIKSNKSTKSLKSLLGFNKDTVIESPMLDLSVDIGKEASKFDSFDFQDPESNEKNEIGSVTYFEEEDKTIKVTKEAPVMLSSNLSSMQQVADQFVSGAKGQCQKILAATKKADDKEALINDKETDEDMSLQLDTDKILSNDLDDMFIAKKDEKLDKDDNTTTFAQTHDIQMIESIGFPSNTVPEETTIDDIKNTALDDEEFLVNFD